MFRFAFVLSLLCICRLSAISQINTDNLWTVWQNESLPDTVRLNAIHSIAFPGLCYSNPDSARALANMELDFAKKGNYAIWEGKALNTIAVSFNAQSKLDSAEYYLLREYEVFKPIKYKRGLMYVSANLAEVYRQKGEHDKALENNFQTLTVAEELGDQGAVNNILLNIGGVYLTKSDFINAIDYFTQALKMAEQREDTNTMVNIYVGIGNVYAELGFNEKAIENYKITMDLSEKLNQDINKINPLNNIGEIYSRIGDYEKAIVFFKKSLALSKRLDIKFGITMSTVAMASAYKEQKRNDSALFYLNRVIPLCEEIGDKPNLVSALAHLSEIQLNQGDITNSKNTALKAYELASEIKTNIVLRAASKVLFEAYKASGDFEKALSVHEEYLALNDSITSKKNKSEVLRQEYEYEYEKVAIADSLIKAEEALKIELAHQEEISAKNQTRNLLAGGALLVLLLAGGAWRRSQFIKKANKQLAIEKQKAQEGEAFKQSFLANMSHEIRTPMNAILGMTNLTLDTSLNEKQQFYLKAVQKSAENLLVIINDVLDISKLESGGLLLEKIPFDIKEVVDQVKTTLQFKAEEKSLKLIAEIDESLPEYVMGDPTRLGQILMNLSGNAIKFTEQGEVVLKVANENGRIHFAVKDTGPGIAKEQQAKLFESFQQADRSTTRRYGGTGLGLSISKSFVEMMGGELALASEVGKGAEFSFTIELPTATAKDKEEIKYTNKIDFGKLKGISILLAEDNKYNQIVVVDTILNMVEGAKVEVANNGKEAIEMLEKNNYHLILMDSDMPEMDGRQATEGIRKMNSVKKDIPIVALTASVLATEIDKCMDAGMNDYIPKPFKREEFFNTLSKYYLPA